MFSVERLFKVNGESCFGKKMNFSVVNYILESSSSVTFDQGFVKSESYLTNLILCERYGIKNHWNRRSYFAYGAMTAMTIRVVIAYL